MKKLLFLKGCLYLVTGIVIIALNSIFLNYLSYIIGPFMIFTGLEEIIYHLVIKDYKYKKHTLYTPFVIIVLAILILSYRNNSIELICIVWGIIIILRDAKVLNECIYYAHNHDHFILEGITSIISFVLAVMLIINPLHHAQMHLIILGIELVFEAIKIYIKALYYKKNPDKLRDEILKREELLSEIAKKNPQLFIEIKNKYKL